VLYLTQPKADAGSTTVDKSVIAANRKRGAESAPHNADTYADIFAVNFLPMAFAVPYCVTRVSLPRL
jgi:hypothetical protein